jgi:phosphatidate cytidylyltransferase
MEVRSFLKGEATLPPLQSLAVLVGLPFVIQDLTAQYYWFWIAFIAWAFGIFITIASVKSPSRLLMSGIGASLWPTGGLICLLTLHQFLPSARAWEFKNVALLALVPLWVGDSLGYFVGKAIGKHPMAPKISPKKTLEGAVANFAGCVFAGWMLGSWLSLGPVKGLVGGVIAGIFGQLGDLFESWVKRSVDLKDSGSILPGHGGIMDRIDSVLFAAPVIGAVLNLWPR